MHGVCLPPNNVISGFSTMPWPIHSFMFLPKLDAIAIALVLLSIPNFDEVFGSRFVNAADLSGPVTVIMEKIDAEDLARPGEAEKRRAILYFRGRKKGLVLKMTWALQE